MDIAELRHLARRLCAWLKGGIAPGANYQQCLHYVAAVVGRRNWSEVVAMPPHGSPASPPPPSARRFDEPSASRLARRLNADLGIEVSVKLLMSVLSRPDARPPTLWPEGIEPGVYLTIDPAAIVTAIAMYRVGSKHERYYVETPSPHAPGADVLAPGGLGRPETLSLTSGTLVLADPIDLSEAAWRDSIARIRLVCETAGMHQLRILLPVRTQLPANETLAHVQLLARSAGPDLVELIRDILPVEKPRTQIVEWSRTDSVLVTDRRPWAETGDFGYLPFEPLPRDIAEAIESAVVESPFGLIVIGKLGGFAMPSEELLEAMLAPTEAAGPAARIVDSMDEFFDLWAIPWGQSLPVQPSIAAAYANGFRRMVINTRGLLTRDMIDYADRACIIVNTGPAPDVAAVLGVLARAVGLGSRSDGGSNGSPDGSPGARPATSAATNAAAFGLRPYFPLCRLLAVVGILSCSARGRPRETVADCYVRRGDSEALDRQLWEATDFILADRVVSFGGQVFNLLHRKVMTVDDMLYHFPDAVPGSGIRALLQPDRRID